jgi:DNA-binding response OmpR family regulator
VRAAPTLRKALDAANEPFDLLISDIGLPDGNGLQLMREIRSRRNAHVPGIALSGFGSEDDVRKSRDAGFEHHLVKPIDFDRLVKVIGSIAERKPT